MSNVLKTTMKNFDGGYVVCGITGSGEMFSMRDPWGIRPAFYYKNDEIVVVASERPVLQTTFDLEAEEVQELMPGTALLVKKNGECSIERIMEQKGDSAAHSSASTSVVVPTRISIRSVSSWVSS